MVDNNENIFVEFDYNNITLIDPNKVVDSEGKIKDRLVNHEDLVMYANLECNLLPRTKLALGVSNDDRNQTITVGSINFLKQGDKTSLDNSYTDELTGKGSLKGNGVNQVNQKFVKSPNKSAKNDESFYVRQTLLSDGEQGGTDNGLLGITSINISQGLDFLPTIRVSLEDIKGRAMFEGGDSSPYAAFFNFPYPKFYLTIKGYYGKAVRLPLMLQNFSSRYDTGDGNFKIELTFYTYKYTILTEVLMGSLLAVPHMYSSRVQIQTKQNSSTNFSDVEDGVVELGYQKIRELYDEYKSKGMISDDFPELTLMQLKFRLEQFIKNTLDTFTKENLDPLSDVSKYINDLSDYSKEIFEYRGVDKSGSWFSQNMDTQNFFILNDVNKTKVYTFRKELRDPQKRSTAISNLKGLIVKYNSLLAENDTLGQNGSYVVGGKPPFKSEIPNPITYDTFYKEDSTINDIDLEETYRQRKGINQPTSTQLDEFKNELITMGIFNNVELDLSTNRNSTNANPDKVSYYYVFEGEGTFMGIINEINVKVRQTKEKIQEQLTDSLSELLKDKGNNGIGFVPTIRNVLAVIFANAEAFLRLMDDTHREAWNVRDNKARQAAIFNSEVANANPDNISSGVNDDNPVYPWPQFIVATNSGDDREKYEIAYPGDDRYTNITKGYLYEVWPEVEFVEEYLTGLTRRGIVPNQPTSNPNGLTETNRVSVNAIEFPIGNDVYQNKEKVKYFYEIYERLFLTSNYTGLVRVNGLLDSDTISNIIADVEKNNIVESLSNDNPFLIQDLKSLNITGENFLTILEVISNDGQGQSWNNLTRGIFNTGYIKNEVENGSFAFINSVLLASEITRPQSSLPGSENLVNYLKSSKSNVINLVDTYPFTDLTWIKNNLQDGNKIANVNKARSTSETLFFNEDKKVISNFKVNTTSDEIRPITNFGFKDMTVPNYNNGDLSNFYFFRNPNIQLLTEGNLNYYDYSGLVRSNQSVSIMNTPYFINSLQNSADKIRNKTLDPFLVPAYLFINSLPLATLREKFTNNNSNYAAPITLDYIFSTIKKFGGVHNVPYAWVLKIGSEWHRYKTYIETNIDILGNSWNDFDENSNYDPLTSSPNKKYNLNINGSPYDMVMEETVPITYNSILKNSTMINSGFYPKLINDFTYLYEGRDIFTTYSDSDIQLGIDNDLDMTFVQDAVINYNDVVEDIKVVPWSVFYKSNDGESSFIIPSNGSLINQTKNECIDGSGVMKFDIKNNQSMYNGSVRLFWSAPNYGYFDNSKVVKPEYNQHMKKVYSDESNTIPVNVAGSIVDLPSPPQSFSINGIVGEYSNISEMFSVFEKDVMDQFEGEFLNFTKSRFDLGDPVRLLSLEMKTALGLNENDLTFNNFHLMFIEMSKLPKITLTNGSKTVEDSQYDQMVNISNYLSKFLDYDISFKYGNPGLFDKKLFYSFANGKVIVDGYTWNQYTLSTPNALPTSGNTVTLASSKLAYPNEWLDLELYVGFSDIPELEYGNSGSYITDFFVDNNISFESQNIKDFSPIIKIYATQKLNDSTMTSGKFSVIMGDYLNDTDDFQNKITNSLTTKLKASLPDVDTTTSFKKNSVIEGDQTKVELYETFKALNDKWISGNDFSSNKTLFEDVLLLDRASRDIGDKVFVDIYKLKDSLFDIENSTSMDVMTFIKTIIVDNGFNVMNLPSYVNFYNVQDVVKNPIPKPEDTLEIANTLFGTFANVDYRNSSTKLVCFYGNQPSSILDLNDNIDYRFKSDSFDLRRTSDNPLLDDITTEKSDYAMSNKVVGFNVDIGPQNQSIFTDFRVSQDLGKATSESIAATNALVDGNQRGASTQNLSLYNLYKNRHYSCILSMMGNALMQPTMYFNLRHVPMFNGPYMITRVDHTISPGTFETIIEGIRQSTAGLPKVDGFLQTLRANLLNSILEKNNDRIATNSTTKGGETNTNVISEKTGIVNDLTNQPNREISNTSNCAPDYNGVYTEFNVTTPSLTKSNYSDTKVSIETILGSNNTNLKYVIFASIYLASNKGNRLMSYDNNFSGIDIKQKYSQGIVNQYMSKKTFYCSKNITPYVSFNSLTDNIGLLKSRWEKRVDNVTKDKVSISKFLILNSSPTTLKENVYTEMGESDKKKIEDLVNKSITLYDVTQ
ncbi:hypothetical protein OAA60_01220 [Porticoccaceae bacterium]|nr:hypothetical protein [Porticoccaceae bacterium]